MADALAGDQRDGGRRAEGGARLIRDFGEVEQLQVSIKGPGDFVSTADLKAERTLKTELTRARPGLRRCCSRRAAPSRGSDPRHRWIVDPLDGTTNFLHGIPHFAISIALERDGEIVAGLVYEPIRDEMYSAEKGARRLSQRPAAAGVGAAPARRGGDRHRHAVSATAAIGRPISRPWPRSWRRPAGCAAIGAAALDLAYVAAGRFDGFWEFGLSPWDIAAGHAAGARGGRLCQRPVGRPRDDDERRRARRQRPSAPAAGGADPRGAACARRAMAAALANNRCHRNAGSRHSMGDRSRAGCYRRSLSAMTLRCAEIVWRDCSTRTLAFAALPSARRFHDSLAGQSRSGGSGRRMRIVLGRQVPAPTGRRVRRRRPVKAATPEPTERPPAVVRR